MMTRIPSYIQSMQPSLGQRIIPATTVPLIPGKFYLMADNSPPKDKPHSFFFNIDNDLVYDAFYEDFGPLNLGRIWKYVNQVHKFLTEPKYNDCAFYHFTSPHYKKYVNAILLACCYLIIMKKRTPEQAFQPFKKIDILPYRDAAYGQCSYHCTILDCLRGLQYAILLGWFDIKKFDITEYEHYQQIQNGDINWVIPNKFVAFSTPYDDQKSIDQDGNKLYTPKDYVPIFKKLGVDHVVRLNTQTYRSSQFTELGIKHSELYFNDGTCPSMDIVQRFLKISEENERALAVHCKAGLGRTGTLIGCYAIKHYHFNAGDFIGWIRMCRPGSVIGPQQYFLHEFEEQLKKQGQNSPIWKTVSQSISEIEMQDQMQKMNLKGKMSDKQKHIWSNGDVGQGGKLMEAKKKHDKKHDKKQK